MLSYWMWALTFKAFANRASGLLGSSFVELQVPHVLPSLGFESGCRPHVQRCVHDVAVGNFDMCVGDFWITPEPNFRM